MTTKQDPQDRRRLARMPVELRIEYRRMDTFFADFTKNISRGGTFVKTPRPLPLGTKFSFQLAVPGVPQPFALVGEVRWTSAEGRDPGMGVRFVWENDAERLAFEKVVEDLMVDTLGAEEAARLLAAEGNGQ
jgi:type IV pilus assembly protein PilZ